MSFGSLLLRVMLILAFVLNGTASAMAAAQMSLGHPMPQAVGNAPEPVHHEDMSACHPDAVATDEAEGSHESAPQPAPPHHGDLSGCCDGGGCLCVCAHGMHATVPAPALALHIYGWIDEADAPTTGHAAPALPHLIRPPIG